MQLKNNKIVIIIIILFVGAGIYFWQYFQFKYSDKKNEINYTENNSKEEKVKQLSPNKNSESENNELNNEKKQLLSLDPNSIECKEKPITKISAIGGNYTIYPIADIYKTSADDFHNIAGLFTAAACSEERLKELFGLKKFIDVAIFTENQNDELINYLKENGFMCHDKKNRG